jgi:hypothetical protein
MAVTNFSPLLGLALPTTGDLSGTWGTTVNDSITQLLDSAVAGTTTLSADADVTLSTTNGAANQARNAVILWTASNGASTRNITAPAQSKAYLVINSGTGSIVLRGAGPTTGITVVAGEKCLAAWNGSDFVKVSSSVADGVTSVGGTGTVNGITLSGTVTSTGDLTLGGTLSNVSLTTQVTGTLPVANGGLGLTAISAASIPVANTANTYATVTATAGQSIRFNAGGTAWEAYTPSTGSGDVVGPASSTNGAPVAFDGVTGKLIKQASVTGTGNVVLATSPTLVTPALGTPASGVLSNTTVDGTNKVGYLNIPYVTDKTTSYSLAVGDVGEVVGVGSGGSITIPDATFAAGDAVLVFNNTAGDITITCTITTAYIAGTDADVASVTLATRGVCNILFISGTVCVITGNVS